MPLSAPKARKHLHTRTITCTGYEREDGLWDIEGHMTDQKTYAFENDWRGTVGAGDKVHEMWLRLTLDDHLVVQDAEAVTDNSPFEMCPNITDSYKQLIGIKVGLGWRRAIRQKLGGRLGCTHLTELLAPIATVALQTMMPTLMKRREERKEKSTRPPGILDTCHAWSADSEVVKKLLPDHYAGEE